MIDAYQRARSLVGTRFRPLGRSCETGLDCVGLVLLAYQLPSTQLPIYRLSSGSWSEIERIVRTWFDPVPAEYAHPGDLRITRLSRSFHFGVLGSGTWVHADLRLGRVVEASCSSGSSPDNRTYHLARI